jgi:hypothetical protein
LGAQLSKKVLQYCRLVVLALKHTQKKLHYLILTETSIKTDFSGFTATIPITTIMLQEEAAAAAVVTNITMQVHWKWGERMAVPNNFPSTT